MRLFLQCPKCGEVDITILDKEDALCMTEGCDYEAPIEMFKVDLVTGKQHVLSLSEFNENEENKI